MIALMLVGTAFGQDALLSAADFPLTVSVEDCPFEQSACVDALEGAFALWADDCLPLPLEEAQPSEAGLQVTFTPELDAGQRLVSGGWPVEVVLGSAGLATDADVLADCADEVSLSALAQFVVTEDLLGVQSRPLEVCELAYEPNVEERIELGEALVGQVDFTCVPNLDGADVLGAVPLEVTCTLDDAKGLGAEGASWRMGDGTVLTGPVVTHTYTEPGNYSVGVAFEGDPETCALATAERTKVGYVTVCARPDVAFELYHDGGLSYTMLNKTDVAVYGCIYDMQWSLYRGGSARGKALEGALKAWEPTFELPEEGRYTIKAEATGIAGQGAAVMTFQANRGVGDGLQKITCASACSATGGAASGWPLLMVAGLRARRRRE